MLIDLYQETMLALHSWVPTALLTVVQTTVSLLWVGDLELPTFRI